MSEDPPLSQAALRRELRRRRILANTDNRMDLVTGKKDLEEVKETKVADPKALAEVEVPTVEEEEEAEEVTEAAGCFTRETDDDPPLPPYPEEARPRRPMGQLGPNAGLQALLGDGTTPFNPDLLAQLAAGRAGQPGVAAAPQPPPARPWTDSLPFILLGLFSPWLLLQFTPYVLLPALLLSLLHVAMVMASPAGQQPQGAASYVLMAMQLFGVKPGMVKALTVANQLWTGVSRHMGLFVFCLVVSMVAREVYLGPFHGMDDVNVVVGEVPEVVDEFADVMEDNGHDEF